MATKNNILLLMERPGEPVFTKKGADSVVFDVPSNFLTERYKTIGNEIQTRFGEGSDRIRVSNVQPPNLNNVMKLSRDENFSIWIPAHRKYASELVDIFMGARSVDDLQSYAVYARDRVNPYLFNYALSVALLHRPDTKNINLPSFVETFPGKFVDQRSFGKLREEANIVSEGNRMPIIIPRDYTASEKEPEHALWYFREDLGVNVNHWHWHLLYPVDSAVNRQIVDKDRRGEIFFYMHQQMMARYNFERLCNGMPLTATISSWRETFPEGYYSKLDTLVASRAWPGRPSNFVLKDLNREADQIQVKISDMETWEARIRQAIRQGYVVDEQGRQVSLLDDKGIDILGNVFESSVLSVNKPFYGDLHNFGHVVLSYVHDPDHRHLEGFSPVADPATAMRDPVFYRLHAYTDNTFWSYKDTLPPYSQQQLTFPGIEVSSFQVQAEGAPVNTMQTFWQQSDVNMTNGLDFSPRGNVFVRFTHLQHSPFTYTILVNNTSGAQRLGMVRIYLAPRNNDRRQAMTYVEQRRLFIEMERFIVAIRPGQNTIRRKSIDSNVTIPFEKSFRSLENKPAAGTPEETAFNYCGCGWPNHMLVPRGAPGGFQTDLFVMISNYDEDRVDQDLKSECADAASYCGIRDKKYPDKKPMGYPFERMPRPGVSTLQQFLTPNMKTVPVNIIFDDKKVVVRGSK